MTICDRDIVVHICLSYIHSPTKSDVPGMMEALSVLPKTYSIFSAVANPNAPICHCNSKVYRENLSVRKRVVIVQSMVQSVERVESKENSGRNVFDPPATK